MVSSTPKAPAEASSKFDPSDVRYIKLGRGGSWAENAFAKGILPIGFGEVPHSICASGEWTQIKSDLRNAGYRASTATNWTRELRDFYEKDSSCLWFTVANGHLYWSFAEQTVIATESSDNQQPQRHRSTIDGWHRCDLNGVPLTTRSLSSALLRTASYQMTICSVLHQAYLIRRIRGEPDPLHVEATALQARIVEVTEAMILQLDWRDFEILVDLIFARGGWQRHSALGDGEVDNDLLLTMPTTGETAWVQIKSEATQAVLDDYLSRFTRDGSCKHFFFVCHTSKTRLYVQDHSGIHLWTGPTLAKAVIAAGLFDWLINATH